MNVDETNPFGDMPAANATVKSVVINGQPVVAVIDTKKLMWTMNDGTAWKASAPILLDSPVQDFQVRAVNGQPVMFWQDGRTVWHSVGDVETRTSSMPAPVNAADGTSISQLSSGINGGGAVTLAWFKAGDVVMISDTQGHVTPEMTVSDDTSQVQEAALAPYVWVDDRGSSIAWSPDGKRLFVVARAAGANDHIPSPTLIYTVPGASDRIKAFKLMGQSWSAVVQNTEEDSYTAVVGKIPNDPSEGTSQVLTEQYYGQSDSNILRVQVGAEKSFQFRVDPTNKLVSVGYDVAGGFAPPEQVASHVERLVGAVGSPNGSIAVTYTDQESGHLMAAIKSSRASSWALHDLGIVPDGKSSIAMDDVVAVVAAVAKTNKGGRVLSFKALTVVGS